MSLNTSKNLGQISAVFFGTAAPNNINLIWMDTSTTPYTKMVWNGVTWVALTAGLGVSKAIITIGSGGYTLGGGGTTLTGSFFSNPISEIRTDHQVYIIGQDFSQSGTTITGITITFVTSQKLVAEI